MIVCSCNVISDHQVRSVTAERTVRATSEVYRCLGCSAECGRCARTIRRIMDEALADATSPLAARTCVCAAAEKPAPRPSPRGARASRPPLPAEDAGEAPAL
ncbi:MAG TPA: (2Fe-2S)-binding protein [Xanthobacteraceae bacterium]|nr:(2Fe-2S)-binding protein [Xanthobacteraceae bacterium]